MSHREEDGLRGPVKSYTGTTTHPGWTDVEGKVHPEITSEHTMEYHADGRLLASGYRNPDGSLWLTRFTYDGTHRLLKTASGIEGQAVTTTTYFYDKDARIERITDDRKPGNPVRFRYDELGRKTKIETSTPADYRPNVAQAGSPFSVLDHAPNLADGGSALTTYDENDRPTEVRVQDANGELLTRATLTYDAQGRVIEEKQILDRPELMISLESRAKMMEQSGLSADQLHQELRAQLTQLMGGRSGPYSVVHSYDESGRMKHTSRSIFNHRDEIETSYNERGDVETEITHSTRPADTDDPNSSAPPLSSYSEVHYSYTYDPCGNWVEKRISYRSNPQEAFQASTAITRKLTYY